MEKNIYLILRYLKNSYLRKYEIMPAVTPIRFINYVCQPNYMIIEAKHEITTGYLNIVAKVNNKPGLHGQYHFNPTTNKEDYHILVKHFCDAIQLFSEDEIQDYAQEDEVMAALNLYRYLKKVQTKSGTVIWTK